MEFKVKLVKETDIGLNEILGVQSILYGNLKNGNIELYRLLGKEGKAELPYFASPWQKITDCQTTERGSFSKKTFIQLQFQGEKSLELELQEKVDQKSILADYIAFKHSAEKQFPKGANEKAVESLEKISEALGEAFGRGLNKAKSFGRQLQKKVNKEREKQKKSN